MLKKTSLILLVLAISLLTVLPYKASSNSTTIQVDPPTSIVSVGEIFNVNITVTDVTNLTCWELKLYYQNTRLNCTAVIKGPFLDAGGGTYFGKTITNTYNSTHGRLLAYCTLLGNTSVSGSGTLVTITFKAETGGSTALHLDETQFGDENIPPDPIQHTTVDGVVHVGITEILDIALTNVAPSKTIVGQSYPMKINVTVENQGDTPQIWNVTAYANTSVIETKEITLTSGNTTTIPFEWNTTGWAKGNYTISAYAWPVSGETDITDNTCTDDNVLVTVPGDVDGDRDVDIDDLLFLIDAFWGTPSAPNWNPNADIDNTQTVSLDDLLILTDHFWEHW